MRPSSGLFLPLLGIFALGLGACIGSNDDSSTDTGATNTNGETAESTTTDTTPLPTMNTEESTVGDPTMTGPMTTVPTTTEPDDTTMGPDTTTSSGLPQVVMETTLGTMVVELDDEAAPITVDNFLTYVDAGFYDGGDGLGATIFHRVLPGFVAQGGGFTESEVQKTTMAPIVNESGNGLTNIRGSIAMARLMAPDTANSQFYFNLVDNPDLDIPPGYAVFGNIVEGLEVMDAIGAVETAGMGVPLEPVIILSVAMQ